jgi:2-polyprenyl-3-methyl-5-hydroxy-6-metoxy-1,4-benzoquinol methylase
MNLPAENIFGHTKKLRYILSAIERVVAARPDATIVDFGCGNGSAVSQYIIAALPNTARYVGVDLHQPSVDFANRHYAAENATFQTDAPFAPGSIDVIVYADVLEHVDDPDAILAQQAALLRQGGVVVGSIPNGIGPFELESALDRRFRISQRIASAMARLKRRNSATVPYNIESGHIQFFRKRSFIRMLQRAGLATVDFRNGCFIGAMVSERVLRHGGAPFMRFNTAVANVLPYWAVSTWLFTAERGGPPEATRYSQI